MNRDTTATPRNAARLQVAGSIIAIINTAVVTKCLHVMPLTKAATFMGTNFGTAYTSALSGIYVKAPNPTTTPIIRYAE